MATTRRKRPTKAEKAQADQVAELEGALDAFATGLGEHVVASNQGSLGLRPGQLIRGLMGRLGAVAGLLEFFVKYDDHNGSALVVRVRAVGADQRGAGWVNRLLRHEDVIRALDVGQFRQRVSSEFRQVDELQSLRAQVRKLEEQVQEERQRGWGRGRGYPFPFHGGMTMHTDGPFGRG